MSIFGFGTPSELQTHVGIAVKAATDSLRLTPDWSKNIDICDEINRKKDAPDQAAKAIRRRLQDSDQQTVYLTLILLEACMKNCGVTFASAFDRSLMDEVINISKGNKGNKNADEALRLIQQWARTYEKNRSLSIFFDTYMSMKSRGVVFPKEEVLPPAASPEQSRSAGKRSESASKPSVDAQRAASPPAEPLQPNVNEVEKLRSDLGVVVEQVKLCREMLLNSPGIKEDEALSDVVGFLEACRDRLVDIVEAGAQGILGEELFEFALKVNDAVSRTLEAERTGLKIDVEEGFEKAASDQPKTGSLLDFDGSVNQSQSQHKDDLFGLMAPVESKPSSTNNDPFEMVFTPSDVTSKPVVNSVNPFDDTPSTNIPAAPKPNVNSPDDIDLLFDSAPTKAPPAPPVTTNATPTSSSTTKPGDDFDDFFASLK